MSLIPSVGRKSTKIRIFTIMVYTALIILGSTMIAPFLITITGSTANDFDYERFWPAPRYFWSSSDRFVKCLVPYFNGYRNWIKLMKVEAPETPDHWSSWSLIGRDVKGVDKLAEAWIGLYRDDTARQRRIAADYAEFCESYPLADKVVYASQMDTVRFLMHKYENEFKKRNPKEAAAMSGNELRQASLELLGQEWALPFESFYNISFYTEMNYPMDFQGWFPPLQEKNIRRITNLKKLLQRISLLPA